MNPLGDRDPQAIGHQATTDLLATTYADISRQWRNASMVHSTFWLSLGYLAGGMGIEDPQHWRLFTHGILDAMSEHFEREQERTSTDRLIDGLLREGQWPKPTPPAHDGQQDIEQDGERDDEDSGDYAAIRCPVCHVVITKVPRQMYVPGERPEGEEAATQQIRDKVDALTALVRAEISEHFKREHPDKMAEVDVNATYE
jgi:hypothetical protein